METNPNTNITPLRHGGFVIAIDPGDGTLFSTLASSRMLATILADTLTNDVPYAVDFLAWADHYVTEIWPDEVTRLHGYVEESYMRDACATDVEPCHYVYAAIGLGLLDLPTRWDSGPWHPTGLHFYGPQGEIVVTGWDDANDYTVGAYAHEDVDHEGGDIVAVPTDDLIDYLNGLFAMLPEILPNPIAPEMLAAAYLTVVRTNGPKSVHAVAACDDIDLWEITHEIHDCGFDVGLITEAHTMDPLVAEQLIVACGIAARFARDVCFAECPTAEQGVL